MDEDNWQQAREQWRADEEALRARLVAFGWRDRYNILDTAREGVELTGTQTVSGDRSDQEVAARLTVHECPRCGSAVLDRDRHMDWHYGGAQ